MNQRQSPSSRFAGSNLVDAGRTAVHTRVRVTSLRVWWGRRGGHGESLRRTHGDAAGAKLGNSSAKRSVVNVGTIPLSPVSWPSWPGAGRARRRPKTMGWDGAPVVVRGRESRPHGEGGQQVRSDRIGMAGGRR